ncbi:hypothetical protein DDE18_12815 [Nocardioides gansuensis]|uniref:Uncharacterized protein n=1 Tax=Nocardioides gansuensis TaxID=2138300 RepID=A0A2T8F9L2_9ACTN|nr:hypothetical protein [Nocardioides gansuensis]PVG82357.1 hypothetical protein DDE18_12815 [Nocardioides gansuensis]
MLSTDTALHELRRALEHPPASGPSLGTWRWSVRQRMAAVRDLLIRETDTLGDAWLAARQGASLRERNALLTRLGALGPKLLETHEVEPVRDELLRLLGDIDRHLQRLRDLAYDEVELELGGSE